MSANHSQQLIDAPRLASLISLIEPRSVAVIGTSSDPTHIGGRPIAYTLYRGYAGQILLVNPNRTEIQGLPAFASVAESPQAPDVATVAVPAPQVLEIVRALGHQGACSAIVFFSGFNEVGEADMMMQGVVVVVAHEHGMHLLGPNALDVLNSNLGYYAFSSTSLERGVPLPSQVGIATQSDVYGAHLLDVVRQWRLRTPICVAIGNEIGITLGGSIGWLVESLEINVVTAYTGFIRNVDSLLATLEAAHRAGKPVTLHKAGCSALGSCATLFHTAPLADDDKVLDAVLGGYMVIHVGTTEELMDVAYLTIRHIYPVDNSLGMITVSGGAGITVSDVAEGVGLPTPPMPDMAQGRLKARLSSASLINPVDCIVQTLDDLTLVRDFTGSMVVDGGYRSLLVLFTQAGTAVSIGVRLAEQFRRIKEAHPERPFVVSAMGEGEELAPYEKAGLALFEDPTRVVMAIQAVGRLDEAFVRPLHPRRPTGGLQLPASAPGEAEVKHLLACVGIEPAAGAVLGNAEEVTALAEGIRYPVVLKLASADIQHEPETGGMLLDVNDADVVYAGFQLLLRRAAGKAPQTRLDGVLMAYQLQGGVGCSMGIQCDPLFSPVALFGPSGVFVEMLQDVVFRHCPFEVDETEAMIRSIRGAPLLFGARG